MLEVFRAHALEMTLALLAARFAFIPLETAPQTNRQAIHEAFIKIRK